MFTGLIEEVGTIKRVDKGAGKIYIAAKLIPNDTNGKRLAVGDSVAVNGVCLTVVDFSSFGFTADVMPETFRRTGLGELAAGSPVNLERAMAADGRFGGHIVSGHVDGTGTIAEIKEEGNAVLITVSAGSNLLRQIAEKGSIAIDGISLTVANVTERDFTVSLIPHTVKMTNLSSRKAGDSVNLETDVLAKYVERLLAFGGGSIENKKSSITRAFLAENGF